MNHHYLPRFYSEWWKSKNSKVYSVKNGKLIEDRFSSNKSKGSHEGLYKLECEFNKKRENYVEEKHYSRIDFEASKILRKLNNSNSEKIHPEEKMKFIELLVSMLYRHPTVVKESKNYAQSIVYQDRHIIQPGENLEHIANDLTQNTLIALATSKNEYNQDLNSKYLKTFCNMFWKIVDYEKTGFSILTSDYPVQIIPTENIFNDDTIDHRSIGDPKDLCELLLKGGFFLAFPLSPRKYFFAFSEKDPFLKLALKKIDGNNSVIEILNKKMCYQIIKEFIISYDGYQKKFIMEHFKIGKNLAITPATHLPI